MQHPRAQLPGRRLCRGGILPVERQRGGIVETTMTIKDASFLPILRAVGKAVQTKRLHLGISQEELARRAKLHRTYISDVERGSRSVSLITLVKLAEALHTNASVLVECAEKN